MQYSVALCGEPIAQHSQMRGQTLVISVVRFDPLGLAAAGLGKARAAEPRCFSRRP